MLLGAFIENKMKSFFRHVGIVGLGIEQFVPRKRQPIVQAKIDFSELYENKKTNTIHAV